ncbi:MAG: radical SAM protein [Candidatus Schekmanbacteria bacterium]|nr:radical SAM protein [Candidatus Schekmanbacteria bacterium]
MSASRLLGLRPFFLSHLITGHCNFLCPQCLWKNNAAGDLTAGEIRRFYAEAQSQGFIANYVWGGEPLQRRDVAAILAASRAAGLFTLVNTNAWFLAQRLDEIAPSVDAFILSLDHPLAELHDAHRGLTGSHARVLDAIDLVHRSQPGLTIIVNTLVMRQNLDALDEMLELWRRLGVAGYMNFIERDLMRAGRRDETRSSDLDLTPEELRRAAAHLARRQSEGAPILNSRAYFDTFANGRRPYRCHFPKVFLEVCADGSVVDCTATERPVGNVSRDRLRDILGRPRIAGMIEDGARWCSVHNNADRIDTSLTWELHPPVLLTLGRLAWGR